ncbi:hypothetical protein A1O7_03771 [Cladophialophora yegresii CBS 114405]|uniref:Uncharacterized protein n=1 Tax=Cladophialophora yegresii CBS 114405 TaxID=1182544 RepID=W9W3P5_9EURO|nr:uncharacterized protein A1O7_03771 [Cladophialophora yegresii CBS 114405]EXJ59625.1 hypothetical protein A1O7_03771 [Cladophialophora yegresii CBS 114405]
MLNETRRLIHPLHSAVQNFPVTAAGVTATCMEELRKKVKETVNYMEYQRGPHKVQYSEFDLTPLPTFTYAHARGCVHSDEPRVVLKSKADVRRMDDFERARLAMIDELLEFGVDHDLNAHPDGESTASVRDGRSTSSVDEDEVFAGTDKGSPPSKFLSSAVSTTSNSKEAAEEEEERWMARARENEARSWLRDMKKRLEECLATSSLAKGIYFKRCNRQWVSALGGVLPPHSQEVGARAETKTKTDAAPPLRQCHDKDDGDVKSALSTTFTALTLNTTTNTAYTSDLTTSTTTSTNATSVSRGTTPSVVVDRNAKSPTSYALHTDSDIYRDINTIFASYAFAVTDPEILLDLAEDIASQTGVENSLSLPLPSFVADLWRRHNPACSPPFEYRTSMLMAREELVRIGQVSVNDLALTSWGYNRLVRKQAKAHEEEMKAKANGGVGVSGDGAQAA